MKKKHYFSKEPQSLEGKSNRYKMFITFSVALVFLVAAGIFFLPSMLNKSSKINNTGEFKIIEELSTKVNYDYISVVFLDGCAYSPTEWLSYSMYAIRDAKEVKGNKLGEINLDLRGYRYIGTPPDFSSTLEVGTEVFEIENVKWERAIIVKMQDYERVFYRERKAVSDMEEPINLTVSDIVTMITDNPLVTAIELRSEENGAWMRTSRNQQLLDLINSELPELALRNSEEMGKELSSYRVPINLMFQDKAMLHMQVYPEENYAYLFGGYIPISEQLAAEFTLLYGEGDEYQKASDLLPYQVSYQTNEVSYLYLENFIDNTKVLCADPQWSIQSLYQILSYYRVSKQQEKTGILVMTAVIGKSKEDSISMDFYEDGNKNIYISVKDELYQIVKGELKYEHLENYLYNSTELGNN